ncbi:uncharacterized protein [Primulina eburnea]|uniref:uncharacterized protein n=1 Tax=Primulina eburnea TaxID=1245227 RepID=UPI003C6CB639
MSAQSVKNNFNRRPSDETRASLVHHKQSNLPTFTPSESKEKVSTSKSYRTGLISMDKEEPVKDTADDVTRESLIEISYRVPEADPNAEKSPKDVEHEKVIAPIVCDGDEKTRSKLISISYSPSPDVKGLPLLPGQVDG